MSGPTTEAPDAPATGMGEASPVPLAFSLPLLIPLFAVVAYVLGRTFAAPIRLPDPPPEADPTDPGPDEGRSAP